MKMKPHLIHMASVAFLMATGLQLTAAEPSEIDHSPSAVWANALLDRILSTEPSKGGEPPSRDREAKNLIGLGTVGWEETYRRFAEGRFHTAIAEVLGNRLGNDPHGKPDRTEKILKLLDNSEFVGRNWVPQIISRREPMDVNKLLLPFLSDPDPELREAVLLALEPLNATPSDIESALGQLANPSKQVRFRANEFLQRATGHIPIGNDESGDRKAEWSKWWEQQKPAGLETILQRELTRCAHLLVNPDEEIRERAGLVLIARSGQVFYGFHQKNVWWGVHNGERSGKCWLQWLELRYPGKTHAEKTLWEHEFHHRHPEVSLDALRATITMNVKDLDSDDRFVRMAARESIAALLEDSCPFRFGTATGSSNTEDDWLNEGIKRWWEQRVQALKE